MLALVSLLFCMHSVIFVHILFSVAMLQRGTQDEWVERVAAFVNQHALDVYVTNVTVIVRDSNKKNMKQTRSKSRFLQGEHCILMKNN